MSRYPHSSIFSPKLMYFQRMLHYGCDTLHPKDSPCLSLRSASPDVKWMGIAVVRGMLAPLAQPRYLFFDSRLPKWGLCTVQGSY